MRRARRREADATIVHPSGNERLAETLASAGAASGA